MLKVWIQVCGPLVIRLGDEVIEPKLPGRQGRELAAFLIVNRARRVPRDELVDALWWQGAPDGAQGTLSTLVSRLRRAFGGDIVEGKSELRLKLPADAWIDLEVAERAVHEAEAGVAQGRYADAWSPSRQALHAATRGFMPGYDAPWIDTQRGQVENIRLRALEATAGVGLGLGGAELASVERSARALIAAAPFRETGYRLLMEYFARRDDVAEALRVYEELRELLRDELGVTPSASVQELHSRLLRGG